jgi:hypothetical protein
MPAEMADAMGAGRPMPMGEDGLVRGSHGTVT